MSYDEQPYINEQAEVYEGIDIFTPTLAAPSMTGADGDLRKVERCVSKLEEYGIDITGSYEDWFNIGAALSSLGEKGRYYFHRVSRLHPDYKYHVADKKFNDLLKGTSRVGLGTFFFWCQQYGITYKKDVV